ncbi:hypothetical protein ACTHAM_000775 [Cellulomonas soli]|uniref:hypothetical protein n=1 Tax=Cellulomonas soli TaxID=931535 RepID=UPI003F87A08D
MGDASQLDLAVFVLVLGLRLVVPLFIPRFPLPALIAALVIDGVDQTVFATFTDLPLDNYQSYDKALDIYYLTIAYLAVIRNWRSTFSLRLAAGLWYYRLVGVLAFELTGERWLLMVFPNTFEYFVIAIEVVRTRWDAGRLSRRALVWTAALIWVVVKLPQEWWIHVAQLDFTDEFKRVVLGVDPTDTWSEGFAYRPWVVVLLLVLVVALWFGWRWLRRRLPAQDWPLTLDADRVSTLTGFVPRGPVAVAPRGVGHLLEKVALAALVTMIMVESYPRIDSSPTTVALVVGATVVAHAGVSVWRARGHAPRVGRLPLGVQVGANTAISVVAILVFAAFATGRRGTVSVGDVLFFGYLVALVVTLYDRYTARREACERPADPSDTSGHWSLSGRR